MILTAEQRKARERALQNERFAKNNGSRSRADAFYAIATRSHQYHRQRVITECRKRRTLEIGCGGGSNALKLAECGAVITGIDLSDVAIAKAKDSAKRRGFQNASFYQMDAEALDFENGSFDVVCGGAILHHLDTQRAFPEIARVLRPDGKALFLEPLGYNPLINLYRRLTPSERTPDEHPLRLHDLRLAAESFGCVRITYYYLTALLALPVIRKRFARGIVERLNNIDAALFSFIPALRKYAWIVVLEMTEPRHNAA